MSSETETVALHLVRALDDAPDEGHALQGSPNGPAQVCAYRSRPGSC
jgi:hypothetical protein